MTCPVLYDIQFRNNMSRPARYRMYPVPIVNYYKNNKVTIEKAEDILDLAGKYTRLMKGKVFDHRELMTKHYEE